MTVIGPCFLAHIVATVARAILLWYSVGMIYEVLSLTCMYAVVMCLSLGSGPCNFKTTVTIEERQARFFFDNSHLIRGIQQKNTKKSKT